MDLNANPNTSAKVENMTYLPWNFSPLLSALAHVFNITFHLHTLLSLSYSCLL